MSVPSKAIFVREGRQWDRVPIGELLYMEADDNSTTVHTTARSYSVPRMLKDVLDAIADERIQRIHRCHAVNIERVQAVSDSGVHLAGRWLPIGRSFKPDLLKRLRLL
jgi:DNA-binding LytR/AlgR family response regulator